MNREASSFLSCQVPGRKAVGFRSFMPLFYGLDQQDWRGTTWFPVITGKIDYG
jgi:hypothetical protein